MRERRTLFLVLIRALSPANRELLGAPPFKLLPSVLLSFACGLLRGLGIDGIVVRLGFGLHGSCIPLNLGESGQNSLTLRFLVRVRSDSCIGVVYDARAKRNSSVGHFGGFVVLGFDAGM